MDATQKEIEDAARAGGAHDFIIGLPEVGVLFVDYYSPYY